MQQTDKIIVIGGSAGCLPVLIYLLHNLPAGYAIPVVVVLHRLKNATSEMGKIIDTSVSGLRLVEPDDKQTIMPGNVYFAPANYHLLVEEDKTFSLDYSEPVQYSRPSIDVSFESVAGVYGASTMAVLLSGANGDGATGMGTVILHNGVAIVQHPDTSTYPAMPKAAIRKNPTALIYTPHQILQHLKMLTFT